MYQDFNKKRTDAQTIPYKRLIRVLKKNSKAIRVLLTNISSGTKTIRKNTGALSVRLSLCSCCYAYGSCPMKLIVVHSELASAMRELQRLYEAKKDEFDEMPDSEKLYKIRSQRELELGELTSLWHVYLPETKPAQVPCKSFLLNCFSLFSQFVCLHFSLSELLYSTCLFAWMSQCVSVLVRVN